MNHNLRIEQQYTEQITAALYTLHPKKERK